MQIGIIFKSSPILLSILTPFNSRPSFSSPRLPQVFLSAGNHFFYLRSDPVLGKSEGRRGEFLTSRVGSIHRKQFYPPFHSETRRTSTKEKFPKNSHPEIGGGYQSDCPHFALTVEPLLESCGPGQSTPFICDSFGP